MAETSKVNLQNGSPENVFLCPGPDLDLDYDLTIKEAEKIFRSVYPDLEFLPRAPDPEEIIIGDESDDNGANENAGNVDFIRQNEESDVGNSSSKIENTSSEKV